MTTMAIYSVLEKGKHKTCNLLLALTFASVDVVGDIHVMTAPSVVFIIFFIA